MPEFTGIEPFTTWDGAFTPAELDAIVAYGDGLNWSGSMILARTMPPNVSSKNEEACPDTPSSTTVAMVNVGSRQRTSAAS